MPRRRDGSFRFTDRISLRLGPSEEAALDAFRRADESISDAVRRAVRQAAPEAK